MRVDTGLADEGMIGHNFEAHLADLQKRMLDAAGNLEFEEAARLRDEIRRLRETELAIADDPLARQSDVEGRAGAFSSASRREQAAAGARPSGSSLARKPTLDEMGARGEVPLGGPSRIRGPAGLSPRSLARKNTLDEMTVGRTEKPLGGPRPEKPAPTRPGLVARGKSARAPTKTRRRSAAARAGRRRPAGQATSGDGTTQLGMLHGS